MMKLTDLIKVLDDRVLTVKSDDFEVRALSCNSKSVKNDFLFVAIKGEHQDGGKFITEAIKRGARAVVVQSQSHKVTGFGKRRPNHGPLACKSPGKIPFIEVKDSRLALAKLAAEFYGNPSKKMNVIGVTGTNGKTTVTYLIEAILKQAGKLPAVIGTINYRFNDKIMPAKNTTPGPLEIQSMLSQMQEQALDYAIMEVSSHALDQARVAGIRFHCAIFTNLTQDHLDYHLTLENYFQAKLGLFKSLPKGSCAILNSDDVYARRIPRQTAARVINYGTAAPAQVIAKEMKFSISGTEFLLETQGKRAVIKSGLIGLHNVYNSLAAISFALSEGVDLAVIKRAFENFSGVPGRLERVYPVRGRLSQAGAASNGVNPKGDFAVFVDYAHTADALDNVIRSLRRVSSKRIIVVFGCGGDRDQAKRKKMGKVVSELSDFSVITNDNPRSEAPLEIISQIKLGMKKDNYCVIPDRRQAIKKALSLARPTDIVLIAGKGHENYQIIKGKVTDFDDYEVARACLKSKK